jgi:bacterioferritin
MPKCKFAEIHGDELLKFRTGANLLPYCKGCVNSERAPVTMELGCTKGDDPQIQEYFSKLDAEKVDQDIEKCPGFMSRENSAEGDAAPESVVAGIASMVKEVPTSFQHVDMDWERILEEELAQVSEVMPQDALVIDRAIDQLVKDRNRSYQDCEQEYYYSGQLSDDDKVAAKIAGMLDKVAIEITEEEPEEDSTESDSDTDEVEVSGDEIIGALQEAYNSELTAWVSYVTCADSLSGALSNIAEEFNSHADEEREHLVSIGRKITALGEFPESAVGELPSETDLIDEKAMEEFLLNQEQGAIEQYNSLLELCGKDTGLRSLIETIIEKETEHADDIKKLIGTKDSEADLEKDAAIDVGGENDPTFDENERNQFFQYLRESGLAKDDSEAMAKSII